MKTSNRILILLIAGILIVCLASAYFLWQQKPAGAQVVVTYNGEAAGSFSLHEDLEIVIGPEDGSWHNTLQIRNGRAAIIESDCENQICVNTPPLSEDQIGIIVCLPHGLVVELKEAE